MNTKPAETDDAELNKDVDKNCGVSVTDAEEYKNYKADDVDDEEGGDPDEGGVDEVVVDGADADDEEGVGGDRDGGEDDGQNAATDEDFVANLPIFKVKCTSIWNKNLKRGFGVFRSQCIGC